MCSLSVSCNSLLGPTLSVVLLISTQSLGLVGHTAHTSWAILSVSNLHVRQLPAWPSACCTSYGLVSTCLCIRFNTYTMFMHAYLPRREIRHQICYMLQSQVFKQVMCEQCVTLLAVSVTTGHSNALLHLCLNVLPIYHI